MNYWEGYMNWPVKNGWKCETCGDYEGMTWGFVHGTCRCNQCHAQYTMRDKKGNAVDIPLSLLKDDYKEPAKTGWELFKTPMSEWEDSEWEQAIAKAKE